MSKNNELSKFEDLMRRREAARRGFYAREPKRAADVMAAVLQRRGYARVMENEQLTARWADVIEPRLRPFTRPIRIHRQQLEVLVANSTVLHELTFSKDMIVRRLNDDNVGKPIKDIRFRIGIIDAAN